MATSPGWLYPASGKIPSPRLALSDFSSSERQTNMLSHISIYNSGGSVKRHHNSREPDAGSRAPPAFIADPGRRKRLAWCLVT